MNKKGQIGLLGVGLITIIVIIAFIFSSTFRFLILGTGLIIGSFILLLRSNIKNDRVKAGLFIVVLGIGLVLIFSSGILQSITGVSTYEDIRGNTHWLVNGVANNIDEGYTFSYLPNKKVLSDGTEIRPQEEAVLIISKKDSSCEYQMKRVTKNLNIKVLGITVKTLDVGYWELLPPERVALVSVKDDRGSERIIDGTTTQSVEFYDNGGTLTFTTLGTLGSKRDCESASNVAVIRKEGVLKVYEKNDYDRKIGNLNSLSVSLGLIFDLGDLFNYLGTEPDLNTNFLSNFDDYKFSQTDKFTGDVDIGNVAFTIDADQKYYNSFIYTPPKEVKPRIDSIIFNNKLKTDSSNSVQLVISNRENSEGTIIIKSNLDSGSISPTSKNTILKDKVTENFILKASNREETGRICFEVCSVSSPVNCDEECKSFEVKEDAKETCGNGICESFESYTTCPQDCKKPIEDNNDSEECKWYQEPYTKIEKDYGFLYYRAYTPFVDPIETQVKGCRTASWVNWLIIGLILSILSVIAFYSIKPKRRRR